jgi:hypothetical protein
MSGPETRPLQQVAADVIAADVNKTALLGRLLKDTGGVLVVPDRTGPSWFWIGLGFGGLLVAVVGGFALGFFGGGTTPSPSPSPSPTAVSVASPTPSAIPTAVPTASPPTPSPSPSPSPVPPATGSSIALGDFSREGEQVCDIADTFSTVFDFVVDNGALTLTQLDVNHVTTGTITRTGPADAIFSTAAEGQTYEGTITGTRVLGTHVYTAQGCNDTYSFDLRLLRPLMAPAPFNTAPGFFTFLGASGTSRELPVGEQPHIVVSPIFDDGPVITDTLPIRIVLNVGNQTPWDFLIDGDPSATCNEEGSCSADAPGFVMEEWFAPGQMPMLIAYDNAGAVLAVYAPNGMPEGFSGN